MHNSQDTPRQLKNFGYILGYMNINQIQRHENAHKDTEDSKGRPYARYGI